MWSPCHGILEIASLWQAEGLTVKTEWAREGEREVRREREEREGERKKEEEGEALTSTNSASCLA